MPEPAILTERDGGTLRIVLNRPATRNALDPELGESLAAALRDASADESVRVVVLTGSGTSFCAGARLDTVLAASERGDATATSATFAVAEQVYRALLATRPPTIAAVNGYALAGGAGIVSACDLAIAAEHAQLGYPEVRLGLMPGMVMGLLVRLVGFRTALDLALSGRRIGAAEAARIGLVNEVVQSDRLAARASQLAHDLATLSPTAVSAIKRWAWTVGDLSLERALSHGRDVSTLCALTEDARAGMRGFLERRVVSGES
ncbi:MAG: enoyl-CoA hydratase/isomerase family protein [Chloroflexi bacterium]|nr:enoyl-CoA hydratase/isomerase family protein [Chloroflexota bacterium]